MQSLAMESKPLPAPAPPAGGRGTARWLHPLTSAGLMLAALALYGTGADSGHAGFVIAGIAAEMAFWVRIAPLRRKLRAARSG